MRPRCSGQQASRRSLGALLAQRGREAAGHFQLAVDADPRDATAQNNYGAFLLQGGHAAEAVPHFQKALEVDPRHAQARSNLGIAYYVNGDLATAIRTLEEARALDPRNANTVHYQEGRAHASHSLMGPVRRAKARVLPSSRALHPGLHVSDPSAA